MRGGSLDLRIQRNSKRIPYTGETYGDDQTPTTIAAFEIMISLVLSYTINYNIMVIFSSVFLEFSRNLVVIRVQSQLAGENAFCWTLYPNTLEVQTTSQQTTR